MASHQSRNFFLASFILFMLATVNLKAQQIVIDSNEVAVLINQQEITWLIDKPGQQDFKQIINSGFTAYDKKDFLSPKTNWAIWCKLELSNKSGFDQEYILQTAKWGLFEVYIIAENENITHLLSGSLIPLHQRSQPSNTNAVKFLIGDNETKRVFLKFKSQYSIYLHKDVSLRLVKQTYFEKTDRQRLLWQGLFFGIILVMALYNLFILFAVRDISYLYYVLSIISIGLYFAFYYGFGIEYLWPGLPRWDTFFFTIINPFTGLVRILFTRTYLHTPHLLPRINRILNALATACVITLITGLGCYFLDIDILKPLVTIIGALGALVLIMMLVAGIAAYYYDKYEPAKYFIAANILLVIGAIAFIFRETGLIADNFFTRYLVQYGVLIQAVVLSLGLASRLNRMRLQLANETITREQEKKELIEIQKRELQQQVNEKTSDLQQKNTILSETVNQLTESENKLSQLNQVKDKLFSVVSHDLRNPLATMQSFLRLVTEHDKKMSEAERQKSFSEAQQSLDNLNELLYNLLQWSKSQMNLLQYRPDKLNIKLIIDGTVKLAQLNAQMKDVKIKTTVEEGLTAYADKDMAEFIVRNLLSNAIKFSYRNSNVEIKAFALNKTVVVEIIDNGVGLSETKIKTLLKKNTATTQRGTEKEKGTGLGLLICKEFIAKNGGELQIKSEPGKGSVFSFTLPGTGSI